MRWLRLPRRALVALPIVLSGALLACSSSAPQTPSDAGAHPVDAHSALQSCSSNTSTVDSGCNEPRDGAAGAGGTTVSGGGGAIVSGEGGAAGGNAAPGCVPTPEVCDGKDNDCDGIVDNGFQYQGTPVGSICYSAGQGACISIGRVMCTSPSAAGCTAVEGTPDDTFHATAAPDGSWDWNCNNNVDRKYPLASCESFTAATCPAQGWQPEPGQAGDCGQSLLQQACNATATGCQSTGPATTVTEQCK